MLKVLIPLLLMSVPLLGCATRGQLEAANERVEHVEVLLVQAARDQAQDRKARRQSEAAAATREATLRNQMDAKDALQRLVLVDSTVAAYSEEMIDNRRKRAKIVASGEARDYQLAALDSRQSELKRSLADDIAAREALGMRLANVEAIVGEHSVLFDTLEGNASETAISLVNEFEGVHTTGVN